MKISHVEFFCVEPMTSLPVIWALTSGTTPSNGGREISNKKLKKNTSNRRKGLKFGNMSKKVIFYTKMQKDGKWHFRPRGTLNARTVGYDSKASLLCSQMKSIQSYLTFNSRDFSCSLGTLLEAILLQ